MRPVSMLPLLLLSACKPEEALVPLVTVVDGATPERVEVAESVGQGGVEVFVRTLNRYGAAVEGGEVTLEVTGPTATAEELVLDIDPTGYGELEVTTSAPEAFSVEVIESSSGLSLGEAVTCWSVADDVGSWGLRPSWTLPSEMGAIDLAASLLEGVVLANEQEVWYLGIEPDARPHSVLSMPDPILELESVHVDNDGLPDVLVRSVDEVVLLRGRPGGGLAWGAGLAAEGLQILGASLDDVDGDTLVDLGIVLQGSAGVFLVIMAGDGAWGFEELEELRFELDFSVVDVELSQSDSDGEAEVALLSTTSTLMRYYWSSDDETWGETFPSSLETHLAEPASFLGAADMNGAGSDDPAMLSHAEDGVEQSVVFYTLEDGTTQYQKSYLAPAWALADLTGDGNDDIVALEGGDLNIIHFVVGDGNPDFAYHVVGNVQLFTGTDADEAPVVSPIAVGLLDGDRLPDLAIYSDGLHIFPGTEVETGWASTDADWTRFDLQLLAWPAFADLDKEEGLDTMAGWINAYAVPTLRTWWMQRDEHSGELVLERRGEILFEDNDIPLGVAIHDGSVYGLWDDEGSQLVRMVLDDDDSYDEQARGEVEGTELVAGTFPDGAVVAVLTDEGAVSYFDDSLAVVASEELGSWGCATAGDTDGDGVDELLTATGEGCSVLARDLDGDGVDEVATLVEGELEVAWGDDAYALEAEGSLSAHDIDGDGALELLSASGGQIRLHRALANGFAPATGLHGVTLFEGPLTFTDTNGDGLLDLLAPGEDGTLVVALGQ